MTSFVLVISSSLTNLLLQLTKLRETFYLLGYLFILKGYNSGTASGRNTQGKDRGKGEMLPSSHEDHSPQILMYSPTQKLSQSCPFGFLMESSLLKHD